MKKIKRKLKLWHYTTDQKLPLILKSRKLIRSRENIEFHEKAAVWFSSNPDFENTAKKLIRSDHINYGLCGKNELFRLGIIPIRIQVNDQIKFYSWKDFKKRSGITKLGGEFLEQAGRDMGGSPNEWFAVFNDIAIENFVNIEIWNGSNWEQLQIEIYNESITQKVLVP